MDLEYAEQTNYGADPEVRTPEQVADLILAEVPNRVTLAYVDYRDELGDENVARIVRGETDDVYMDLDDGWWEMRGEATWYIMEEARKDAGVTDDEWDALRDDGGEIDNLIVAIGERDESDIVGDLVRNTGAVLLRIASPITEDGSFSGQEVEPAELLARAGLPVTDANLAAAWTVIANASPEYGEALGYYLANVSLSDVYDLPYDCQRVTITNPGLWLGSPLSGSGWAEQFEGTVTVDRSALRTDADAFGYSWSEVVGGFGGGFDATIAPAD